MNANTRILVVDDDPIIRETLSLNLEDQDFQVQGLPSGEALLDHLRQGGSADLILLDWKMGPFTGLDTLREMRRMGGEIPVTFLTRLTDQIYEEAAVATGTLDLVDHPRRLALTPPRGLGSDGCRA